MLSFMNYTHAPLTNWGLKLVDVQDGWTMLDVGCGGGFTIRRLLKAASKRGQSQTKEQREQCDARINTAESRLSSRNSNRLSFAEREQARPKVKGAQVYGIDISEESVAKAKKVNANVLDKQVFIRQGSAEKLPYEDEKFDLVTAVETVYFWPNLPDCLQEVRRVLKSGGKFAILVEVVDSDSKWTNIVEGMTAYSPEDLKKLLDDAGFNQTEIHRKKPTYATILGVKPSFATQFFDE